MLFLSRNYLWIDVYSNLIFRSFKTSTKKRQVPRIFRLAFSNEKLNCYYLGQGGGLAAIFSKNKSTLFLFGKFGNLIFARIPFETGCFFILFSILFSILFPNSFPIWLLQFATWLLLLQGFMQMLGGFRHRRIWMSSKFFYIISPNKN